MAKLIIQGGNPLSGEVAVRGAKNSGFKLLIASLFADQPSLFSNITKAGETKISLSVIKYLGGSFKEIGEHSVRINPRGVNKSAIPSGVGKQSRSSTMFAPVLLYRFGKALIPWPGGDKIGKRPLKRHFAGFEALGVSVKSTETHIEFQLKKRLKGTRYRFEKNTHTGTDTMIMLASWAEGETILENAAAEPEVDDLICYMNKIGANIKRISPRVIKIKGAKKFKGAKHLVIPDRNEAVTFACAALGTKGSISIFNIDTRHLTAFIAKLKEAGAKVEVGINEMKVSFQERIRPTSVETQPHPGFMTDWQALWFTLMTQAWGKSTIIERIFPSRFQFAIGLEKMGAKIKYFNPQPTDPKTYYNFNQEDNQPEYRHGVYIYGPTKLKGATINVNDIRAGATLTLAALIAQGESVLNNAELIDRGYENLPQRLRNLGGVIKRI